MTEIFANMAKDYVELMIGTKVDMVNYGAYPEGYDVVLGHFITFRHKGEKRPTTVPIMRSLGWVFNGCDTKDGYTYYTFANPIDK